MEDKSYKWGLILLFGVGIILRLVLFLQNPSLWGDEAALALNVCNKSYEQLNETYEDTLMLIESLKNTPKGDFTHRILWASDCPVGKFNQTKESYARNLQIFKERVLEKFNDKKLLNNLFSENASRLYSL